jgi:hypothetical protein
MAEAKQQPITDLPSGDPVPSTGAPKPSLEPLPISAFAAAAPSNLDAFLTHLHRCLQTPSGIDTVLLFLCYTSRLSGSILESISRSALQRSARNLVALAFALPPKTTILLSAAPPSTGAAAALRLAGRLKAFSALLSEGRTFTRLWGLLGMYFWAKRLVLAKKSGSGTSNGTTDIAAAQQEKLDRSIAWTQLISCILFQALENAAYLSQKGVLALSPASQGKALKWSTRFWAVFVGTELGRLGIELARKQQGKGVALKSKEHQAWYGEWRRKFARNLAWAPLTVHWSLDKGFVPDMMIGALACVPGVIQMSELWEQTA